MDDSKLINTQTTKAHTIKVNEEHIVHSKVDDSKVIDAQVVEADILDESYGSDINPDIFDAHREGQAHEVINLDDYGRSIEIDDAERIKDRLNESFTEQFGTAAYSQELKNHYAKSKANASLSGSLKQYKLVDHSKQSFGQDSLSQDQEHGLSDHSQDQEYGLGQSLPQGPVHGQALRHDVVVEDEEELDGELISPDEVEVVLPKSSTRAKSSKGTSLVPISSPNNSTALAIASTAPHTKESSKTELISGPSTKGKELVAKDLHQVLSNKSLLLDSDNDLSDEEREARAKAHEHIKQLFDGVDVEDLAKGLDALKHIKDINKKNSIDNLDEEDVLDSNYFEDEIEDSSLQGMHLVSEDEQDNLEDNDDFANQAYSYGSSSPSSSRALARSAGNIGAFIRAANMVPMLTEEQERDLAKRLREFGDVDAARQLVTSHLRFVVSVARKFTGYGLPLADLIQEGNIGLMKAVKNYDPDVGHGLAAFASSWIKAEMFDYVIRNWRMVKVATTKAQRKLFFNLRKSKKRLGWMSESERSELANDLGVSLNDVTEMEARLAGSDVGFDLDEDDSSDKSVAVTLSPSSYLEDENSNFALNYENSNYAAWEVKKLHEALSSLDSRSHHIIKRRWLDENKATLQELSKELGVSIERVRQLENNAMNKVKAVLLNNGFKDDETVLALEHHSLSDDKSKKSVASARTKSSSTKRASGKGASERLKNSVSSSTHKLTYKSKSEQKSETSKKARKKSTGVKGSKLKKEPKTNSD